MPEKKKNAPKKEDVHEISAQQMMLTPYSPILGAVSLQASRWPLDIASLEKEINEQLKKAGDISNEPEPEDIVAERGFIVDTITVKADTVKEAMPDLRKQLVSAFIASIQECQKIRALHEKNTGRPVRNLTLNADSLARHITIETIAYEEPEEVVRMIDEAELLAAKDFEQIKEMPAIDHTDTQEQNIQARLIQAQNRPLQQKNIDQITQNIPDISATFRYFKNDEHNAMMYPDPLAFLNLSSLNNDHTNIAPKAINFEQPLQLPALDHTRTTEQNIQGRLQQALNKQATQPGSVNLASQQVFNLDDMFPYFKNDEYNGVMRPDPLAFLNIKNINNKSTSSLMPKKVEKNEINKITDENYKKIAMRLGVDPAVVRAIAEVESSGGGFNRNGTIKIRFEGHKFKEYLKTKGFNTNKLEKEGYNDIIYSYSHHKEKSHGYTEYKKAFKLDKDGAIYATSYGAFQIMGFNYKLAGYHSLEDFEKAQHTYIDQVETFINFVSSRKELLAAMRNKDFAAFAEGYNGPDNISNKYDEKLTKLYNKYKK